ncbi:MAG: hypothetical protein HFE76_04135 [Firmicutes bacterium]|nr:hypothetical protein [Bacillota bacterium]
MNTDRLLHGLELSLTIGCRLNCDYCPQDVLIETYYHGEPHRTKALSFEDFKVVLDKVEPGATIAFGGMSEPFHNVECADMLVYAYERGYKLCLDTTLIGMDVPDFEKIKHIEFEEFILHIPDKEHHSKFVITDEYLRLFDLVHDKIEISYYSCHGTIHEAVKDKINEEKYAGISISDRAGNLEMEDLKGIFVEGRIMCWHGSETMHGTWIPVMFPDGSLVLCCQDYGMKHVLGNLIEQSWQEICAGEEYKKFKNGLEDDSIDLLCRNCAAARKVEVLPSMRLAKAAFDRKAGRFVENVPKETMELVEHFAEADMVCIFGLGKLWRDHFYQEYWHEALEHFIFSDNNPVLQGKEINGIQCVKPSELKQYEKLFVLLFVKNGESIISQLTEMGIDHYMLLDDVYSKCVYL